MTSTKLASSCHVIGLACVILFLSFQYPQNLSLHLQHEPALTFLSFCLQFSSRAAKTRRDGAGRSIRQCHDLLQRHRRLYIHVCRKYAVTGIQLSICHCDPGVSDPHCFSNVSWSSPCKNQKFSFSIHAQKP